MNLTEQIPGPVLEDGDRSGAFEHVGVDAGQVEFKDVEDLCHQLRCRVGESGACLLGEGLELVHDGLALTAELGTLFDVSDL